MMRIQDRDSLKVPKFKSSRVYKLDIDPATC